MLNAIDGATNSFMGEDDMTDDNSIAGSDDSRSNIQSGDGGMATLKLKFKTNCIDVMFVREEERQQTLLSRGYHNRSQNEDDEEYGDTVDFKGRV